MITTDQDLSINVSLTSDQHGRNEVMLNISGVPGPVLCISPEQARRLALELVQAVAKVEFRHNLQKSQEAKSRPLGLVNANVLQLG